MIKALRELEKLRAATVSLKLPQSVSIIDPFAKFYNYGVTDVIKSIDKRIKRLKEKK